MQCNKRTMRIYYIIFKYSKDETKQNKIKRIMH